MTILRRLLAATAALAAAALLLSDRSVSAQEGQDGVGERIYRAECAFCHGVRGEGARWGPALQGVGEASTDFMLRTGRMPIERPEGPLRRGPPAYDEEQIAAVVAYVETFGGGGPPIPEVNPGTAELSAGVEPYLIHCAPCHGSLGLGGALVYDPEEIAPPIPPQATPVEIAEAIRIGPGTMPLFGRDVFDQETLDAVVAYSLYIASPRGGLPIRNFGPFTEGFFAWVLGLLPLLGVTVWLASERR